MPMAKNGPYTKAVNDEQYFLCLFLSIKSFDFQLLNVTFFRFQMMVEAGLMDQLFAKYTV